MAFRFPTILLALAAASGVSAADLPFVNWENHPVHALDLSPDRSLLAVAHTADARVQLFDVTSGEPIPVGHVPVGIDPVSVRFRSNTELWVVNHISDTVSVVDVPGRRVRATLATADEPYDVVFARDRAFVSCSQANQLLVFEANDLARVPVVVPIDAEDPRGLAVSPDGRTVYVAIFESGNATTILAGGLQMDQNVLPNVVSDPRGPYAGRNPPPNRGEAFDPPMNPAATPPRVGLIVRRNLDGRWRDDNNRDWTELVSGSLAHASGRPPGWTLPDRDVAMVDAVSLDVRYASGLMNMVMAIAAHPGTWRPTVVGTEAFNEERFEPNVNGRFVRAHYAQVDEAFGNFVVQIADLNPHLGYQARTIPQDQRDRAIGDPRAIAWSSDGMRGWVAGMGSNNVIRIDLRGARAGAPIEVGEGPVALALDEPRNRLYVWNHFEATISAIDTTTSVERTRTAAFNPLPAAIRAGRPLLYDTHRTSGLGQVACASCHVDARMDRLAWDLGDPAAAPARFDQNCITTLGVQPCRDFHAMKGPMTTQTMQDIIGHEPFHWRGDRAGIEAFNPAFQGLLGDDRQLTPAEMQAFEDFLDTVTFPPNPFRNFDNSLPTALPLAGHYTSGRFAMAGLPLGTGNAVRGLELYTRGLLDNPVHCASCHTLPTGMAVNGPLFLGTVAFSIGGTVMPIGPMGENHLGIVSVDGSTNVSIKVPHLRNVYEKVGFETTQRENRAGFGFLHDGSVDSLSRFISARLFDVESDQQVADIIALMLAFAGSGFDPAANPVLGANPPESLDTHAAVGAQLTLAGPTAPPRADELMALARSGAVGLVVRRASAGYAYDAASDRFLTADGSPSLTLAGLRGLASADDPQSWTAVPAGLAVRLGIDRDGDGVGDAREIAQGSNPADAASSTLRPIAGLWFNPARSGHGFDLQYLGGNMFVTWYTYQDDGTPTWYLAAAPIGNPWTGVLNRFTWNPATGNVDFQAAGELRLTFGGTSAATFDWRLGTRSGSEAMQPLVPAAAIALPDYTGTWYDPRESGWGLSIYNAGNVRVSVLYFYDGNNQPRWVLGQGDNRSSETLDMLSFSGFCPGCAYAPVTSANGGQVQLAFDRARAATLTTDAFFAGQPAAHWRRGPTAITPLSDATTRPQQR